MHKNGNHKSIKDQPLSELQKAILIAAYENRCKASFVQARDGYYGDGLTRLEQERARAAICRAKHGLVKRGFIEDVRKVFVLTLAGRDMADALAREPPPPPVITNDRQLDEYDAFLIKMGKRRQTVSEVLAGASSPFRSKRVAIPARLEANP